jgi:prevent-host-death family protein
MKISDVKNTPSSLVNEVYREETRVLVEKAVIPVAAIVSTEDLKQLDRLDEQRAERRRVVAAMREPLRGVSPEEIEQETDKAVSEVQAEMRHEREAAAARWCPGHPRRQRARLGLSRRGRSTARAH